MVHKFLIALIFILTSVFGVQAAQKSEKFTFVAMPQNISEQQLFAAENSKTVEAQTQKMSFLEKILLKKVIKKINKTFGIKDTKFNENLTRIGVIISGIGLGAWIAGYILSPLSVSPQPNLPAHQTCTKKQLFLVLSHKNTQKTRQTCIEKVGGVGGEDTDNERNNNFILYLLLPNTL